MENMNHPGLPFPPAQPPQSVKSHIETAYTKTASSYKHFIGKVKEH